MAVERVGITTSVPIEILYAAGVRPLDLNNYFISSGRSESLLAAAESAGWPRSSCAWAKGVYAAARELGLARVVGVAEGDCSNAHAMLELLSAEGVEVVRFGYPYSRERSRLAGELEAFARAFGVTLADAESQMARTEAVRARLREVDRLTVEGKVTGAENLNWIISGSDMRGEPEAFGAEIDAFLAEARRRPARAGAPRVAVTGIPPAFSDLHEQLERSGAAVVLNEFPRQFAMLDGGEDLVEMCLNFTYPYDVFFRLRALRAELDSRMADGVIHYVQSFCFRAIQDRLLRQAVARPVLTLGGDRPGALDGAALTRVEAFVEMLRSRRGSS